jgi:hypothetical protein
MVGYSIIVVQTIIEDFLHHGNPKNLIWCKVYKGGFFQKNVQKIAIFRTQIPQIYIIIIIIFNRQIYLFIYY